MGITEDSVSPGPILHSMIASLSCDITDLANISLATCNDECSDYSSPCSMSVLSLLGKLKASE